MDTQKNIEERLARFKEKNPDAMPLYADCHIQWKDDRTTNEVTIKLCTGKDEDKVFFNCEGIKQLIQLTKEDNGEDFKILSVDCLYGNKSVRKGKEARLHFSLEKEGVRFIQYQEETNEAETFIQADRKRIRLSGTFSEKNEKPIEAYRKSSNTIKYHEGGMTLALAPLDKKSLYIEKKSMTPIRLNENLVEGKTLFSKEREITPYKKNDLENINGRISAMEIFSLENNRYAIRCKIDGIQQSAEKIIPSDIVQLQKGETDKELICAKYFADSLLNNREISIKR
jgi:hypothetical protein